MKPKLDYNSSASSKLGPFAYLLRGGVNSIEVRAADHTLRLGSVGAVPELGVGWYLLGAAGVGLASYHGYKRNRSIGWAVVWGLSGSLFPLITVPIALAQGFGERK